MRREKRTLPRASLALTSMTSKPSALQMILAALVLPMPGGPLMSTAFLGASFPLGAAAWPRCVLTESSRQSLASCMLKRKTHRCHSFSQPRRSEMSLPLPTSCETLCGLCFSTHSWFKTGPAYEFQITQCPAFPDDVRAWRTRRRSRQACAGSVACLKPRRRRAGNRRSGSRSRRGSRRCCCSLGRSSSKWR